MRKGWLAVAAALAIGSTATAQAQQRFYVGGQVLQTQYKETGFPTVNPTAIGVTLGTHLNPNFAVEARLGTGLSDDSVNVMGVPVTVEIDSYYGIFAKGIVPLGNVVAPYVLVGYSHGRAKATALGVSVTESDDDFSYGVGADFTVNRNVSLGIEWARLFKGDDYKLNAVTLTVRYLF